MHPQVSVLVKLQAIDLSIEKIEETKEEYPKKTELLKENLKEKRRVTNLEREKLEKLEQDRMREERILQQEIQRIEKHEERLLSVKTNKEYQAALKEIALAKESNSEREDNILNILEELDALRKGLGEQEKDCEKTCREFEKESNELEEKLEKFERQLAQETRRREKLYSEIDAEVLRMYKNIRKGRHGIAVVRVKNEFCQGCNMYMPPQLANEVQKGIDMVFCPSCNRILYWEKNS